MTDVIKPGEVDAALEQIEGAIKGMSLQPAPRPVVPTRTSIDDVGVMAANAVIQVYEQTAKQVESMGEEVKQRVAMLDAALKEAAEDMQALAEAADAIRIKGEKVAELVRLATETSKVIRNAASKFKEKMEAS